MADYETVALLIEQVITDENISDPTKVAELVLDHIPRSRQREALEEMLPVYVREQYGRRAMRSRLAYDDEEEGDAESRVAREIGRSWKVQGARALSQYQRAMLQPVKTESGYARLAEIKAPDLRWMAEYRYKVAARTVAIGDKYAALAEACLAHGDCAVGDLPEDVFLGIWTGETS